MNHRISRAASRTAPSDRLLRRAEVKALIGVKSDSSLYDLISGGHFPAPRRLGYRRAVWLESEVLEIIRALPQCAMTNSDTPRNPAQTTMRALPQTAMTSRNRDKPRDPAPAPAARRGRKAAA